MLVTIFAMPIEITSIQLVAQNIDLHMFSHGLVIAEQFQNVDILGNIQNGWKDFLSTGKAGTLAIGLVIGYMLRGITS
jgi:hypothetical protein